jgi:hypothetical protein
MPQRPLAICLLLALVGVWSSQQVRASEGQTAAAFAETLANAANAGNISLAGDGLWCPLRVRRQIDSKVIGVAVCTDEFAPCSLCHEAQTLVYAVTAKGELSFLLDEAKQVGLPFTMNSWLFWANSLLDVIPAGMYWCRDLCCVMSPLVASHCHTRRRCSSRTTTAWHFECCRAS